MALHQQHSFDISKHFVKNKAKMILEKLRLLHLEKIDGRCEYRRVWHIAILES